MSGASIWNPGINPIPDPIAPADLQSIVDLRGVSKENFSLVYVSGYYTAGDGGGGTYFYDPSDTTSTDNGGTTIVATDGGRWKLCRVLYLNPKLFGAKFDGTTNDTAALNFCFSVAASVGAPVYLPGGTATYTQLLIPSNSKIIGQGNGVTILFQRNGSNVNGIINTDTAGAGNVNIHLEAFTVDGNYLNQTGTPHAIAFNKVTGQNYLEIEVKNARASGVVLTNCDRFRLGDKMAAKSCGKLTAGYGVYNFCSDNFSSVGGDYDDCCIGIAIEASGAGLHSNNCKVVSPRCRNNRADFGQSGAGVHFEVSSGAAVENASLIDPMCIDSTGVGINNTEVALTLSGGIIEGNTKAGIATTNAVGINYSNVRLINNGAGDSPGYQAAMRFDDSGLSPASSGMVSNMYVRGATPDGIKTLSVNSALNFLHNDVQGFTNNYNRAGSLDTVAYIPGVGTTIASAATISIPAIGDTFFVSGTTNITSITATNQLDRKITLIFQGALTFTDGSNLRLAGNLVTTADDSITLVCDGTNWYEISRSVN